MGSLCSYPPLGRGVLCFLCFVIVFSVSRLALIRGGLDRLVLLEFVLVVAVFVGFG